MLFFYFFSFQQVTRKWNDENKGTFIKQSTDSPHLFETHSQKNSKALFLSKVGDNGYQRGLKAHSFGSGFQTNELQKKEGVKGSKRVTMDINAENVNDGNFKGDFFEVKWRDFY